jgi:hypothetical protein
MRRDGLSMFVAQLKRHAFFIFIYIVSHIFDDVRCVRFL